MLRLAVVAEPLAVIRGHDHERPIVHARLAQVLEERADDLVGGGDLSIVRPRGVARPERLRRIVGHVGLVHVEEEEERTTLARVDPGRRDPGGHPARPLVVVEGGALARIDRVLVVVEEGAQPRLVTQHVRGHGGARRVAARLQERRDRGVRGAVEREADVVAHPVLRGHEAGEHGDVRRQRHRARAVGVLEEDGVAEEPVEVRRLEIAAAVGRQVVCTQRIDGDEHHGRARERRRPSSAARRGHEQNGGRERQRSPGHAAVRRRARDHDRRVYPVGAFGEIARKGEPWARLAR